MKYSKRHRFVDLKNMFARMATQHCKEDVLLKKNAAYELMVSSDSSDSADLHLSDALDLYEPISRAVEADDVDGYVSVVPPNSLSRKISRKKTKKSSMKSSSSFESLSQLSKSCESLSAYEVIDIPEHILSHVAITLTDEKPIVHKLVRQFESTSMLPRGITSSMTL